MYFDRKKFFDGYRAKFGPVSQQQVAGLERLLTCIENDPYVKDVRWASYILATVKHETADTFTPIHEYGGKSYFIKRYGGQTKKGKELGNDTPEEGYYYAGKGDTQTTGESNYEKAEVAIRKEYPEVVKAFEARTGRKFDLTVGDQPNDELDPQNMLDPLISYATMSYGMRTGMFTGLALSKFIKGNSTDYPGARKVINGVDKKDLIARYAEGFEAILRAAKTNSTPAPQQTLSGNSVEQNGDSTKSNQQASIGLTEPAAIVPATGAAPASLVALATPVVEVESVNAAPSDPEPKQEKLQTIGNKVVAFWGTVGATVLAIGSWLTSTPQGIAVSIVAAAAATAVIYMIINAVRQNLKDKRDAEDRRRADEIKLDRERRAHELQLFTLKSAADPSLNAVRIVSPPTTEIPNSDNSESETTT